MHGIVLRTLIIALGLWVADALLSGVDIERPGTLLLAAMVLGLINAFIRPLLLLITLPFTLVTLGFFILILNAALFGLAAAMLSGFHVAGFGSALGGTLLVSLTSWIASFFIGPKGRYEIIVMRRSRSRR